MFRWIKSMFKPATKFVTSTMCEQPKSLFDLEVEAQERGVVTQTGTVDFSSRADLKYVPFDYIEFKERGGKKNA